VDIFVYINDLKTKKFWGLDARPMMPMTSVSVAPVDIRR